MAAGTNGLQSEVGGMARVSKSGQQVQTLPAQGDCPEQGYQAPADTNSRRRRHLAPLAHPENQRIGTEADLCLLYAIHDAPIRRNSQALFPAAGLGGMFPGQYNALVPVS